MAADESASILSSVAVIIPSADASRNDNLQGLLEDLERQSLPPREIEVVRGVQPNGHARNVGVSRVSSEILVFVDDDVRLGTTDVLRSLVDCLEADERLGMVGTSQLLPTNASRFQRTCAVQIPRSQSAVVKVLTDSDMVTTACCAMRRVVLDQVGGFHDRIRRGVDPELRHRIRAAGYRICVVPDAWHHHPMPESLSALWRTAWRNGAASAFARRHFPETVHFSPEGHGSDDDVPPTFGARVLAKAWRLLRLLLTGQWCGLCYEMAYVLGNLLGRS